MSKFTVLLSRKKIHAQRKFAQGSIPTTPTETPTKPKLKASPVKLFPVRPKTEDFLTYLCFRGTSVLPPHLDLMNVTKEDYDPGTPVTNGRSAFTRDSSPASSSSMSHNNEDSMDVPDIASKYQTPSKKAARASASTPETARGFTFLRNGASRKSQPLSKLSIKHRKRLSDTYLSNGKLKKKPCKGSMTDRLSLKRKAMATLTAANKKALPPSKQGKTQKKLGQSYSDGDLLRRKQQDKQKAAQAGKSMYKQESSGKPDNSRKRKSTSNLQSKSSSPSPTKRQKLRSSKRVEELKTKPKKSSSKYGRGERKDLPSLETHPKKHFSTGLKVKKTFKPHRPLTRAASHLKSVLKAAKIAASKKMKLVKDIHGSSAKESKDQKKLSKAVEQKRKVGGVKKKILEASVSNTSLGSDTSGEIRVKTEHFPREGDPAGMVQCPTYYPSEEQFKDPILYIQSIQSEAEQFGMCKVVPPCSWKMESRELEDFRFSTQIQYIHKMQHKWSPITEQLENIKQLHTNAGNEEFHVPQIGGVDIDLVKLYELVQKYGGMKGTAGKEKKWMKIAEAMRVPKQGDRVSKLYAAYCKYLLSYETLSDEETERLCETVQEDKQSPDTDLYKCIYKGKSQPLTAFHRAARNTESLYCRENSNDPEDTETDYWEIVKKSDDHVAVQGANLDTSIYGSMFPVRRDNQYARHGWNLHNLVESKGSILHHLGLIAGVTVPTLHISMLYTTKCLACNPHNLPTVQYLHQGPGLVWYAVPKQEKDHLQTALHQLNLPEIRDKGFLIPQDSLMVPPSTLVDKGVSLSRCVQTEREFVVVFPSVRYSNLSLGYNLSESVHYGTQEWIPYGSQSAKDLSLNHDEELFSMDAMLVFLARDPTTPESTLALMLPHLEKVVDREVIERKKLQEAGLKESERLHDKLNKPTQKTEVLEEIIICDISNKICYLSMVLNSHENSAFSLEQGLLHVQKKKNLKHCKLMYRYSEDELKDLLRDARTRIKGSNSASPSSSSPKRKATRKSDVKNSPASSK